ncbi:WXG100 family type VII secretion target [Actinocrinis sp.]|uniref:WXG100 family type VII secretion target n=1 Tax=Actinocrinis sp. TaxID=1920516 RepID=UPI002BD2A15F|nr:WXG100 family type VII secretion target [Actinocrinis sp.]HXR73439.1 WXG100 family type VII secretion target [Actinocrinis sp.]
MSYDQGQVMVTFATIAEAAQNTQRTYQSLEQKLNDLHSFLQPMVSTWSGAAAEQYQAKQQAWTQAQNDLGNVLQTIGRVLDETEQAYRTTESSNAQSWG